MACWLVIFWYSPGRSEEYHKSFWTLPIISGSFLWAHTGVGSPFSVFHLKVEVDPASETGGGGAWHSGQCPELHSQLWLYNFIRIFWSCIEILLLWPWRLPFCAVINSFSYGLFHIQLSLWQTYGSMECTRYTQKNGAVSIVKTIETAPFFCVYPVCTSLQHVCWYTCLDVLAEHVATRCRVEKLRNSKCCHTSTCSFIVR
jgi:hypothetical protein